MVMKLEEEVQVTRGGYSSCGEFDRKYPRILDKDIGLFLNLLNEKGIEVNYDNSEQIVTYSINGKQKTSKIPLHYSGSNRSIGYILRGSDFQIGLNEFYESYSDNPNVIVIGSGSNWKGGIKCCLRFEGDDDYILDRLKTARDAFFKIYEDLVLDEAMLESVRTIVAKKPKQ